MASSAPTNDTNDKPSFFKQLQNTKMGKILVFIVLFTFIFKVINYILSFFDIGQELAYTYMIWFMILFFFFVLLPLKRSYIFMTSPSSSKAQNDAATSGGPGGGPGGVPDGGPGGGPGDGGGTLFGASDGVPDGVPGGVPGDGGGTLFGGPGGASGGGGGVDHPFYREHIQPLNPDPPYSDADAETKRLEEEAHNLIGNGNNSGALLMFNELMHRKHRPVMHALAPSSLN